MTNAIQGKYGWYPCDKETYLKLKFLYKKYQENLQYSAKWYRCHRKAEKNRKNKVDKIENLFLSYYPSNNFGQHIREFEKYLYSISTYHHKSNYTCNKYTGLRLYYITSGYRDSRGYWVRNNPETILFNGHCIETMWKKCKPVKNKEDVQEIDCKLIHDLYEKMK